jgi:hypothetical protein
MTAIASMEHVYDRVKLVSGKGSRRTGRLCIMSFVALLAGESHTDAPKTASSFIRQFAIPFNDAIPHDDRQRLKLFAPGILGTNDGLDAERVALALQMLVEEIAPRFYADLAAARSLTRVRSGGRSSGSDGTKSPQEFVLAFVTNTALASAGRDSDRVATAAARLLIFCATMAPTAADRRWYWSKGIDLLDRLCDVGDATRCPCLSPVQVERVQNVLVRRSYFEMIAKFAGEIALSMRRMWGDGSAISGYDDTSTQRNTVTLGELAPVAPADPRRSAFAKQRAGQLANVRHAETSLR